MTRRDLVVASLASLVTLAGVAGVRVAAAPDVMGSTIFDWNDMKATPNKTGEVRQVVRRPTATLDELEMHITTLNPGESSHAPHQHPNEELVIVRQGTVESLNNGELKRVGPGSIIFQATNQLHSIRNVGTEPAIYHVINWSSPGMKPQK
jgi:XRE family transcriptional regulator, regulator of sulfur utilization